MTRVQDPPQESTPYPTAMRLAVGIDVGKDSHWVTAMTDTGELVLNRRYASTPEATEQLVAALRALGGTRTIGTDMDGGLAALLHLVLLDAGEAVVHVPGKAVNRARAGTRGGAHKSDPQDARVIADQVRTRRAELRPIDVGDDTLAGLKLLVRRRRSLSVEQTRRIAQLHELLYEVHPGLERVLDFKHRLASFYLLTRYVTPTELREAGVDAVTAFLKAGPYRLTKARVLAEAAVAAGTAQRLALPGERLAAPLVRELAAEALATRAKLDAIDAQLAEELTRLPQAALIQSLPGMEAPDMGVILTAEFLAHAGSMTRYRDGHHLAAAAGLAPVLRQTGRTRFVTAPTGGNKDLKRALYMAAFVALQTHAASRAYYDRKRREGKTHQQAVIALAKKRAVVLYAMLRDNVPYTDRPAPTLPAEALAHAA